MGYYIQAPTNKGKADFLINMHNAEEVTMDEAAETMAGEDSSVAIVCVVDNGPFEAALFCHDQGEFDVASDPREHRPRRWLRLPRWKAEQLSGYKKSGGDDAA